MTTEDLRQRLAYFEGKLSEATAQLKAKEPFSKKFSSAFTMDEVKTWADAIRILEARIRGIKEQLRTTGA